jgi:undecaprenyl diphosphate synthase
MKLFDPERKAPSFRSVPAHIAVVMDGNGRWANQRGLTRTEGHKAGETALLEVIAGAIEAGVTHVTAYAFSTENWKRTPEEVRFLMGYNKDVLRANSGVKILEGKPMAL